MTAPAPAPEGAFDDDRFAAIEQFADKAASLWRSIGEAGYRGDIQSLEAHCRQVRLLTMAVFQTVKELSSREKATAA